MQSTWHVLDQLARALEAVPPPAVVSPAAGRTVEVESATPEVQEYLRSLQSDVRDLGLGLGEG